MNKQQLKKSWAVENSPSCSARHPLLRKHKLIPKPSVAKRLWNDKYFHRKLCSSWLYLQHFHYISSQLHSSWCLLASVCLSLSGSQTVWRLQQGLKIYSIHAVSLKWTHLSEKSYTVSYSELLYWNESVFSAVKFESFSTRLIFFCSQTWWKSSVYTTNLSTFTHCHHNLPNSKTFTRQCSNTVLYEWHKVKHQFVLI